MNCKGIMNKLPVTCGPTETVERAARLMFEYHIGAIVVVEDEGQLVASPARLGVHRVRHRLDARQKLAAPGSPLQGRTWDES